MRVRAKRLGWNEQLAVAELLDYDAYEHAGDDLEGELVEYSVPATRFHSAIKVILVGGQEADPNTVRPTRETKIWAGEQFVRPEEQRILPRRKRKKRPRARYDVLLTSEPKVITRRL